MELDHGNPSLFRYHKWLSDTIILTGMQVYYALYYFLMIFAFWNNHDKIMLDDHILEFLLA